MSKDRIPRTFTLKEEAYDIVDELATKYSVDNSDVANKMIRTYKSKHQMGVWKDNRVRKGYTVPKNKKKTVGFRINSSLDDWLDDKKEEWGVYKSDLMTRIILYCIARSKRGDIEEEALV